MSADDVDETETVELRRDHLNKLLQSVCNLNNMKELIRSLSNDQERLFTRIGVLSADAGATLNRLVQESEAVADVYNELAEDVDEDGETRQATASKGYIG